MSVDKTLEQIEDVMSMAESIGISRSALMKQILTSHKPKMEENAQALEEYIQDAGILPKDISELVMNHTVDILSVLTLSGVFKNPLDRTVLINVIQSAYLAGYKHAKLTL